MDLASKWMQQVASNAAGTVVFLDWDDREIARVRVPRELKGGERLAYLNAYVRDNLIHPDLRRAILSSLKRKDNYRGKHPYIREKKDDPAYIRKDGGNFPLTNKLDYKFVTGRQMPQPDGTIRIEDDPDDPYPFLRGFVTVINTADPPWTTFGSAGEHRKFSHRFGDGRIAGYGMANYGLGYMQYPDGTVIYCDGWKDLARKGGGDSVTSKSDDSAAVPLDDVTPMLFSSYDIAPAELSADSTYAESPMLFAAADDNEPVEVPDDELANLYALRDRWQAAIDCENVFLAETGAETLEEAVRLVSTERLLSVMERIAHETAIDRWAVLFHVPEYLASKLIEAEQSRHRATEMYAENEEV